MKADAYDGQSYIWGNRYRSMGLYQPVRLVATGQTYMEAPFVRTDRIGDREASLWAQALITNGGGAFEGVLDARIVDLSSKQVVWQEKSRQKVAAGTSFWERKIELPNPKLWWPNGLGAQPLYRLELRLLDGERVMDEISSRFGIRTLELQRNAVWPEAPRSENAMLGKADSISTARKMTTAAAKLTARSQTPNGVV